MIKYYIKISFPFLILLVAGSNLKLYASENDSIKTSLSSEKIVLLKTLWSDSDNAAGLWYYDLNNGIGKVALGFHHDEGDYHRFQDAQEQNKYEFYTNGYALLKRWKFYGDFNYFGQKDRGAQWTDVLEPYDDNPYTLGNKNGAQYNKEYFRMSAKGAWQISTKFNMGFDVNYQTGVGARRKDPRPENKATCFEIKPGIIYTLKKVNFGLNFHFQTAKEDITYENVTDSTFTYFHFKGLGAYTNTQDDDDRSQESITIGGGLQFAFNGDKITNLTEINFHQKETDIKRGETFPLQVVLLEKFQTNVTSTFFFNPNQSIINKLKLYFTDKHIYGHEPVVEPQLIQETYQWSTVGKYTLYWHKENGFGLNYSYYKLQYNNHINWGATLDGNITTSESSYHFVPEKNEQHLNYFTFNAAFEKEIITQAANILLALNGGYRKGFNSSFEIVEEESLLDNVNTEFVQHDFHYFNEQLIQLGGEIQFGRNINLYKSAAQLFLSAKCKHMVSQMHPTTNRNIFTIKLGLNF